MTSTRSIVFPDAKCDLLRQSELAWADVLVLEQHAVLPAPQARPGSGLHVLLLHLGPGRLGLRNVRGITWHDVLPGSVSILGDDSRLDWAAGTSAPVLAAALPSVLVADVAGNSGMVIGQPPTGLGLFNTGTSHLLRALDAELTRGCPAGLVFWTALATALGAQLLRLQELDSGSASLHAGGLSPACLYRVFEHIEANLDDELTVADLAHIARLSKSHFAAAFRKSTGMPPYRFAVHRKTQRAKEMLSDMERPIADIAYALGYSSQAHFTTMFRRMTGQSPGAYRTRLAEQAIPVSEVSRKDRRPV